MISICAVPPSWTDWLTMTVLETGKCWLWRLETGDQSYGGDIRNLETGLDQVHRGTEETYFDGQQNLPIIIARKTVGAGVMTRWIVVGKWQPRLLREGDTSREEWLGLTMVIIKPRHRHQPGQCSHVTSSNWPQQSQRDGRNLIFRLTLDSDQLICIHNNNMWWLRERASAPYLGA